MLSATLGLYATYASFWKRYRKILLHLSANIKLSNPLELYQISKAYLRSFFCSAFPPTLQVRI